MTTAEQIEKLASEGSPASVIAERLGISRQHVYQVAKKACISLPRYHMGRQTPKAKPPKARLLTGGISVPISHSVAGSISELLVAADLMARGWAVFVPILSSKGHDLIASKNGALATFEVRSGYRNAAGALKFPRKPDCVSQYYACVVTGEPVQYQPDLPD